MRHTLKSALETAISEGAQQNHCNKHPNTIDPDSKLGRVVSYLISGKRLHRFQAERIVNDHVLPSTVSGLQQNYGLVVARKTVIVPGYQGAPTRVAQYWLEPEQQERAKKLLKVA